MCVHKNQRGKFVGKISASPSGEKKRKKKRKKKRNQIFILQKRSFLNRKAPEVGSNNDIELFSICIIGFITPCDYVYRYIRVNFSS